MDTIKSELRTLFVSALRLELASADIGESNLIAALGIDSLAAMEILTQVENHFHILIEDADVSLALVDSLDTLSTYIVQKQAHHA